MIAEEVINHMIPPLKVTDDAHKAIVWMEEFRCSYLPVVDDGKLQGFISEEISCKLRRGLAGTSARQDRAANMALPHLEPQRASARISYDTTFPCELWNSTLSMKTNRPPTVRGYVNLNAPRTSLRRTQRGNLATKHEAWVLPEIRFN